MKHPATHEDPLAEYNIRHHQLRTQHRRLYHSPPETHITIILPYQRALQNWHDAWCKYMRMTTNPEPTGHPSQD